MRHSRRRGAGTYELHYAGEVRATVYRIGPKTAGADPSYRVSMVDTGGYSLCDSLTQAMESAETQVRCDGALPEVPGSEP